MNVGLSVIGLMNGLLGVVHVMYVCVYAVRIQQ